MVSSDLLSELSLLTAVAVSGVVISTFLSSAAAAVTVFDATIEVIVVASVLVFFWLSVTVCFSVFSLVVKSMVLAVVVLMSAGWVVARCVVFSALVVSLFAFVVFLVGAIVGLVMTGMSLESEIIKKNAHITSCPIFNVFDDQFPGQTYDKMIKGFPLIVLVKCRYCKTLAKYQNLPTYDTFGFLSIDRSEKESSLATPSLRIASTFVPASTNFALKA